MAEQTIKSQGTQPPPTSERGHPLPRRSSPENSVTLRHHQHACEAHKEPTSVSFSTDQIKLPRRNSSDESQDTARSDPKKWFDRSNENPQAGYKESSMDVDPPFFQQDRQSSQGFSRSGPYMSHNGSLQVPGRPSITHHSSSADDYRSVIDDLTIENQRLKEELKRYKQFGPGSMKKERLFEVKFHGLHPRKRRELETTLRHFAASVGASSEATSQRKDSKHHKQSHGSQSKHASSSSSHSRPVDSAYASASTGPTNSSGTSLTRPSASSRTKSSEQKVERYLQDIPEGLYPGTFPKELSVTERERLVVRKLEQLFTGKISGRHFRKSQVLHEEPEDADFAVPQISEPSREAFIQPQTGETKNRSRDNVSTNSNSNNETTESGGNGDGSGSGSQNTSPPTIELPEQRPTRLRDLDPNRAQNPTENMEYIRHLGLTAPQLMRKDVLPDPEGWVYLNLLANMSQLHIFNVNLDFIRRSIRDQSTKLQLSAKGDKVRWRGGDKGTKFSSDSSERNSQMSPSTDEDDAVLDENGQRTKRQKTAPTEQDRTATFAEKGSTKTGPGGSSDSIHYKPMFLQQNSSVETSTSGSDEPSFGVAEESNPGNHSRWGLSGSGSTNRKKRKADGAMVFYSGAPFCTDLTRDPGDASSTTYLSSGQELSSEDALPPARLFRQRTLSGSLIPYRPLVDGPIIDSESMDVDKVPGLDPDDDDELSDEFPWSDDTDDEDYVVPELVLEPSGVGQVYPEDHFRVLVTTRRPRQLPDDTTDYMRPKMHRNWSDETADSVLARLGRLTAMSPPHIPAPVPEIKPIVEIEYVSGKVRRLEPVPLPPPTRYVGLDSSTDSDTDELRSWEEEDDDDLDDDGEDLDSSVEVLSKRANPYQSDKARAYRSDNTSYDDEGSDSVREAVAQIMGEKPRLLVPGMSSVHGNSSSSLLGKTMPLPLRRAGSSSVATAGGAESGYVSSLEAE